MKEWQDYFKYIKLGKKKWQMNVKERNFETATTMD